MAITKTIIISNAVALLGHAPIISLDNPDALVTAAIQAFDFLLPDILSQNNWRFAVAIQPLVLLNETPPLPWQSIYQLPSGYLKLLRLYPNIYEWDIYNNNQIYTILSTSNINPPNNGLTLSIEYVFQPDIAQLPPRFYNYFVYEIAKYLALSSAQRPDYYAALSQACQQKFAMAAANEAQNRPQFSQVLFPVLANRNIGGFIGNSSGSG